MKEDTSRADCDHEEVAQHRAQIADLYQTVQLLAVDLDKLNQRLNAHILEPCATQSEVATLRIILRAFSHRLAQLEAASPSPPPEKPHA